MQPWKRDVLRAHFLASGHRSGSKSRRARPKRHSQLNKNVSDSKRHHLKWRTSAGRCFHGSSSPALHLHWDRDADELPVVADEVEDVEVPTRRQLALVGHGDRRPAAALAEHGRAGRGRADHGHTGICRADANGVQRVREGKRRAGGAVHVPGDRRRRPAADSQASAAGPDRVGRHAGRNRSIARRRVDAEDRIPKRVESRPPEVHAVGVQPELRLGRRRPAVVDVVGLGSVGRERHAPVPGRVHPDRGVLA